MLKIRAETPEDIATIHRINQEAFGQNQEAHIVDRLRERGVLTISLVAMQENTIIGHIAFSPVEISSDTSSFAALALAPMAVLPLYQNKGIGTKLVLAGLKESHNLGYEIIVVLGHPKYYPRFGFVLAKPKGIKCEFEVPDEAWMVSELKEDALAGRQGTVIFQREFRDTV